MIFFPHEGIVYTVIFITQATVQFYLNFSFFPLSKSNLNSPHTVLEQCGYIFAPLASEAANTTF